MKKSILAAITAVFFAVTLLSSLVSCKEGDEITYITYEASGATEESTDFKISRVWTIQNSLPQGNAIIRLYEGNKYLAYVGVKAALTDMWNFTLLSSDYANGVYSYLIKYEKKQMIMTVDAKKDTISIPNYYDFGTNFFGGDESLLSLNGKIPISIYDSQLDVTPFVFELSKYGFKIFGGVDDVYVPLPVVTSILWYSGEIYVYNGKSLIKNGTNFSSDFEDDWRKTDERPGELVKLSCNLLRFNHDYLYGRPGYYGFADKDYDGFISEAEEAEVYAADKLDFETLIRTHAPSVYTALKSNSYTTYIKEGLLPLFNKVYGDVHTGMTAPRVSTIEDLQNFKITSDNAKEFYSGKMYRFIEGGIKIFKDEQGNSRRSSDNLVEGVTRYTLPGAAYKANSEGKKIFYVSFSEDNSTAVIHFDCFENMDTNGWEKWYAKKKADPDYSENYPVDPLGLFYYAFDIIKAKEDEGKTVKNIVIDVSVNTGGSVMTSGALISFFCSDGTNKAILTDQNPSASDDKTLSAIKVLYTIDLNLDGKIDSEDSKLCKERKEKYNIAILTGPPTFSSANLFAVMAKDAGYKIIGERSSGGSCCITSFSTVDGFSYDFSSSSRAADKNGSYMNVERGAAVDAAVIDEKVTPGNIAGFYDEANIGAAVLKAYGEN